MGPFDHGVLGNTHEALLVHIHKDEEPGKVTPKDDIFSFNNKSHATHSFLASPITPILSWAE